MGGRLGITVKELKATEEGGIKDLTIATNIVQYAITYKDDKIIKKVDPNIIGEALIESIKRKQ